MSGSYVLKPPDTMGKLTLSIPKDHNR